MAGPQLRREVMEVAIEPRADLAACSSAAGEASTISYQGALPAGPPKIEESVARNLRGAGVVRRHTGDQKIPEYGRKVNHLWNCSLIDIQPIRRLGPAWEGESDRGRR